LLLAGLITLLPLRSVYAISLPAVSSIAEAAQQESESLDSAGGTAAAVEKGLAITLPPVPVPTGMQLIDRPNDGGSALLLTFSLAGTDKTSVVPEVEVDGVWLPAEELPKHLHDVVKVADRVSYFGFEPPNPDDHVIEVSKYMLVPEPDPAAVAAAADGAPVVVPPEPHSLEPGQTYHIRLRVTEGDPKGIFASNTFDAGTGTTVEQSFDRSKLNVLLLGLLFAAVILGSITVARNNPNLFIRRIAGLEAVDEAVGRATEMGKPVLHVNGLDPLTVLSTLAGVNILGRIARITANYETDLVVPAFDPVVLTVSQEVVRNAYIEAGRPDAYRADNIYFLTDQQFSYTASVCGLIVRDRPGAIFLLGSFYAESLMLAETGASIGAIQIAGTDQQAQLPFFITACDYTLIGEELYAASAYLSREPMLLGSLKGQDIGKAFLLLVILLGSILSTFGIVFLNRWFTPLS